MWTEGVLILMFDKPSCTCLPNDLAFTCPSRPCSLHGPEPHLFYLSFCFPLTEVKNGGKVEENLRIAKHWKAPGEQWSVRRLQVTRNEQGSYKHVHWQWHKLWQGLPSWMLILLSICDQLGEVGGKQEQFHDTRFMVPGWRIHQIFL